MAFGVLKTQWDKKEVEWQRDDNYRHLNFIKMTVFHKDSIENEKDLENKVNIPQLQNSFLLLVNLPPVMA